MERAYDRETLPLPNDDRVTISEVKRDKFAALRYRERITEERFKENAEILVTSLKRDGHAVIGEQISAVYNGPFAPPFLRRNEVLLRFANERRE